jgi:hypothetical protein
MSDYDADVYCAFCGKSEHEVLIAGLTAFVCDECSADLAEAHRDRATTDALQEWRGAKASLQDLVKRGELHGEIGLKAVDKLMRAQRRLLMLEAPK